MWNCFICGVFNIQCDTLRQCVLLEKLSVFMQHSLDVKSCHFGSACVMLEKIRNKDVF